MNQLIKREQGQSIVIITFALVALIALLALVVDAGNAYVQRRRVQNAFDSASQAGTVAFAMRLSPRGIADKVIAFGAANGVTINDNKIWFVLQNSQGNRFFYENPPGTNVAVGSYGGANNNKPATTPVTVTNSVCPAPDGCPVVGIHAEGSQNFGTFIAQMVGVTQMSTGGSSSSLAKCGACSSRDLFPILIDGVTFSNGGKPAVITEQVNSDYRYVLHENLSGGNVGRFRYVYWATGNSIDSEMPGGSQATSGTFFVNDTLNGAYSSISQGNVNWVSSDSSIRTALSNLINNNTLITVPIADTGSKNTTTYAIKGYARLHITCYKFGSNSAGTCTQYHPQGDDKYIETTVQNWTTPSAGGGCANYGVCAITNTSTTHKAIVTAMYNKILLKTPTSGWADVALVLDLSSSMNETLSGGSSKLVEAQKQLKNFITAMENSKKADLTRKDQLALVTFPKTPIGTISGGYTSDCNRHQTQYEIADPKYDLGGSSSWMDTISNTIRTLTISGNTPTAAGIKQARLILQGSQHSSDNTPVIILVTDGRANVRLDTGHYEGDSLDADPCDLPAVMDMTTEATTAKSNGVIVFVIAMGTDWKNNTNLDSQFPNMASQATNVQYFFEAPDANTMNTVWTTLINEVQRVGQDCQAPPQPKTAAGINITMKLEGSSTTLQATTDAAGQATFDNIAVGNWDIQPASITDGSLTYSQWTAGLGGMNITSPDPLEVKIEDTTYTEKVFLSVPSQQPIACP